MELELPGLGTTGQPSAAEFVPASTDLEKLRAAARGCQGCHLYKDATQTVFGAGPAKARVIMVGEQPGDVEDQRGEPFVGPAGKLLDRALGEAGIDRSLVYVTNAVKHFKFKRAGSGKRRIHATPERLEITACRPWLTAEFAAVRPSGVVVLGATAAKALFGPSFRVTKSRGEVLPWPESAQHPAEFPAPRRGTGFAVATIHPSAVLRADDRDAAFNGLVADLKVVAGQL
jgi:uracil-DNA glycosylase